MPATLIAQPNCRVARRAAKTLGEYFADVAHLTPDESQRVEPSSIELIALAQDRPGELPRNLPTQIRELYPDVDLINIAGDWCEGELRTGKPWEDVPRVYGHELSAWLTIREGNAMQSLDGLMAIDAFDRETASALSDVLTNAGAATVWLPRRGRRPTVEGITAAIWVGSQLDGVSAARLAEYCCVMREQEAPVVALLDFPRDDELALATDLGVAAVLGKPWGAESLVATIAQACGERAIRPFHKGAFVSPLQRAA